MVKKHNALFTRANTALSISGFHSVCQAHKCSSDRGSSAYNKIVHHSSGSSSGRQNCLTAEPGWSIKPLPKFSKAPDSGPVRAVPQEASIHEPGRVCAVCGGTVHRRGLEALERASTVMLSMPAGARWLTKRRPLRSGLGLAAFEVQSRKESARSSLYCAQCV